METKFFFPLLAYLSSALFLGGLIYRFWVWLKTPVPLRIVLTPAPKTRGGVVKRLAGDIFLFPQLLQTDRLLWVLGWSFHLLLLLVMLRHLRYFFYPVPPWVEALQTPGLYAGYFLPIPLAGLLARRLITERGLYLSIWGDYFALLLLLAISLSGLLLSKYFYVYIVDVKAMILGIIFFQPISFQAPWLFTLHFLFVCTLLIYFPFSKLMHGGGIFLSPTHNQRANFKKPFRNPWDFPVTYNPLNLFPPEKYGQILRELKEEEKK